jgi:hypothetical protein
MSGPLHLSGPQWSTLWRWSPAGCDPAPRPHHVHNSTIAVLMQRGLIERDADGRGLYRRTQAGDQAIAACPQIGRPATVPLPLQGGGLR